MRGLASKLQTALQKIGRSNGHSPPESQDPLDQLLHFYLVDSVGEKFFKAQRKKSLDALKRQMGQDAASSIEKALKQTEQFDRGNAYPIAQGAVYSLILTTRAPTKTLNEAVLRVQMAQAGLSAVKVDNIIEKAKVPGKPSESYSVVDTPE